MIKNSQSKCLNCGTELAGVYCFQCGQKVLESSERTFKHFFMQFFGAAFFLESNFLKNLWYLITRPGFLAKEFLEGRRKRYMQPLSLFLLINLFYFMINPITDLNLSLREQMNQPHHFSFINKMIDRRLATRDVDFDTYAREYGEQSTSLSKILIIVHAPIFALFSMLIYSRKKFFFMDHVTFAVYFTGFCLLFAIIFRWIFSFSVWLTVPGRVIQIIWSFLPLLLLTYFFLSIKKFYGENYFQSFVKTIVLGFFFILSHFIYRSILFFVVFWTS